MKITVTQMLTSTIMFAYLLRLRVYEILELLIIFIIVINHGIGITNRI